MNIKEKYYDWIDSETWKAYGMTTLLIFLPLIIHMISKNL